MNNSRSNTTVQTYILPSPNGGNKECFAWLRSIMKKFADSMKRIAGFLPSPITRKFQCLWEIIRFLWRYSGLEHIWERMTFKKVNRKNYKKPPTLVLWAIGLYFALYGIASTYHETKLDRVENRMNAVVTQLSSAESEVFGRLIALIPAIQRAGILREPKLLEPSSFVSLADFGEKDGQVNESILKWTQETIQVWKNRLSGVKLQGINLSGAKLREANLSKANLSRADLSRADLWGANLSETILWETNLHGAALGEANLSRADLQGADLSEADLQRVDLSGAFLFDANLAGADLSGIQNWRAIGSIRKANILGVENAPEGFKTWALGNGAVELGPEEWKAFVEPPAAMPQTAP